jgi:hypothetical protein
VILRHLSLNSESILFNNTLDFFNPEADIPEVLILQKL